jgi:hypothetical protein
VEESIEQEYKKQIEEWKKIYDGAVYVTEIKDQEYIFRGLTRAEFKEAQAYSEDDFDKAEYVCTVCVLYPVMDFEKDAWGGVPEALTTEILRESGFTNSAAELDQKLLEYEAEMMKFDNQMVCIIKEAFQDINIEDIENWQYEKLLRYYSRAKWMLENFRGINISRDGQDEHSANLEKVIRQEQMQQQGM